MAPKSKRPAGKATSSQSQKKPRAPAPQQEPEVPPAPETKPEEPAVLVEKKEEQPLTQANLALLGSLSLEEKLEMYRAGRVSGSELLDNLGPRERQRVWKEFEYDRSKDNDAKQAWQGVQD